MLHSRIKDCPPGQTTCHGGQVTLGQLNTKNCMDEIAWVPLNPDVHAWEFTVDELWIGGFKIPGSINAVSDTGYPIQLYNNV